MKPNLQYNQQPHQASTMSTFLGLQHASLVCLPLEPIQYAHQINLKRRLFGPSCWRCSLVPPMPASMNQSCF